MKITLTRSVGGHAIGDTIERTDKVARILIGSGAAEHVEQSKDDTKASKASDNDQHKRRSQSRKAKAKVPDDSDETTGDDEAAGQQGGGVPPSPSPLTAG